MRCEICGKGYADNYYKDNLSEEIICEDCLLEVDGITTSTITHYFLDGEYIGDDSESIQDVVDNICECCNYSKVEE